MERLREDAEDELDPEVPFVPEEAFGERADNGPKNAAADRREDDVRDCVLLAVGVPHVGDHAECDGAAGAGETPQCSCD